MRNGLSFSNTAPDSHSPMENIYCPLGNTYTRAGVNLKNGFWLLLGGLGT